MQSKITVTELIRAIADLSGIVLDERCASYLQSQRGPLLTAINMADGEAIASTVCRAIQAALSQAGLKGHLTPDSLRALISEPTAGVRAIHDAVELRENALGHLSSFVQSFGRGGLSSGQRERTSPPPGHSTAPTRGHQAEGQSHAPQRAMGSGTALRNVPAQTDAQARPGRFTAPDQPAHREAQGRGDHNPFPEGRSHQGQQPRQSADDHARGAGRDGSGGVRRDHGAQGNVHTLDERRTARRSYADHPGQEAREPSTGEATDREQKNVYGSKASVQFSAGMTKGTDRKPPRPTIYMEAARILNPETRVYDWKNKVILQLTAHELQMCTALCFGFVRKVRGNNHGHQGEADKWFEMEHQTGPYAGTVKITVGKGKDVVMCQMGAEDIGDVTAMFLRQCAEQMKIEQAAVPATLRVVAQAYNARLEAKGSRDTAGGATGQGSQGGQHRYG